MIVFVKMCYDRFFQNVFTEAGMKADKLSYFDLAFRSIKNTAKDCSEEFKMLEEQIKDTQEYLKYIEDILKEALQKSDEQVLKQFTRKKSSVNCELDDLYQQKLNLEKEISYINELILRSFEELVKEQICSRYLENIGISYVETELKDNCEDKNKDKNKDN